jgi:hypothetical protein
MATSTAAGGNFLPLEPSSADFPAIARSRRSILEEIPMFSIANLSSAPSALPQVNVHPHGHKRGSHVESADDSGTDTAAQIPPGAAQNLFGSLLQSLEQVIGAQPAALTPVAATTPAATATPAATTAPGAAATTAAAASAAAPSASPAGTLLQNYLNNLTQNLQANGSQAPKFTGSNLSVSA